MREIRNILKRHFLTHSSYYLFSLDQTEIDFNFLFAHVHFVCLKKNLHVATGRIGKLLYM